nr:putative reverse transcriptase domain-containing protein [Tanacetum cinerariifolium]
MQAARDRQKSYADLKRKLMKFRVGDKVMLKGRTFWQTEEVKPRYVGPFKVLEMIGKVAYKLKLPEEMSRAHNTFHVSNLKKCHADEPLVVSLDGLHFDDKLYFVDELVEIVDCEVKRLKQSRIPLVKEMDTQETDKNQATNDKTKHKMEKIEKDEVNRSRKTKVKSFGQQKSTLKVKVNPENVKVIPDKKTKAEK